MKGISGLIDKKPEIRKFTQVEAAWLAAAIDGEGSFGLYDYGREGRRVLIQMGNTNEAFVGEMRRIIGCGSSIYRTKFAASHKGRKPIYHYVLKGSARCYWVLKQLVPYLIIKKEKASKIIRNLELKPFGRWANATKASRKRASRTAIKSWKNPEIRNARLKGMREAKCQKRS
jgi:hypothetical protein